MLWDCCSLLLSGIDLASHLYWHGGIVYCKKTTGRVAARKKKNHAPMAASEELDI
jgi:hypothetical protein